MSTSISEDSQKKLVQNNVIKILNQTDCSLNIVNRYKENIVHVSAVNNCIDLIKYFSKTYGKNCLERKNAFGWTPLMQAIRNQNLDMVKVLIDLGVNVNDFSYLGMSCLSLACAINEEMFDLIYNSCASALEYAAHDDINLLCVAVLKNDKNLFFKLKDLGIDVRTANAFTHVMMKKSTIPEINELAKSHLISEDYWNDLSDIEQFLKETKHDLNMNYVNSENNTLGSDKPIPKLCLSLADDIISSNKVPKINLLETNGVPKKYSKSQMNSLISPSFSYFDKFTIPLSPSTFVTEDKPVNKFKICQLDPTHDKSSKSKCLYSSESQETFFSSSSVLKRCRNIRPPDLKLSSSSNDSNVTLSFTPQFSPSKSPNLPNHINEDNVFDESTPTPPKYKTPPRGIILDAGTSKLIHLLKRFGLKRHIYTFIEQEVDLELFLNLNDQDLMDIGIKSKSERLIIMSVINECKGAL